MVGQFLAEHAVDRGGVLAAAMRHCREFRPAASGADIADRAGGDDDDREGHAEKEDRDEGDAGQCDHEAIAQRAAADPDHSLDHDREHGGLQPEEQRLDESDMAESRVDIAQAHDGDDARQDEEAAGHDAAGGPVQQPADIGGELLRLRARQQHAVVQRMQKTAFRNPVLLLDQDAVHHRDLPRGAAEAQQRHPQPDPESLAKADAVAGISFVVRRLAGSDIHHGFALLVGQLWVSPVASRHQR